VAQQVDFVVGSTDIGHLSTLSPSRGCWSDTFHVNILAAGKVDKIMIAFSAMHTGFHSRFPSIVKPLMVVTAA